MSRTLLVGLSAAALVALSTSSPAQSLPTGGARVPAKPQRTRAGTPVEVVDFTSFQAGKVVAELYASGGTGPIAVRGYNPFLGSGANAALVFDSARPTGGDSDLGTPHLFFGGPGIGAGGASGPFQNDESRGKVLIIAENLVDWDNDGLVNSPDDLNAAATTRATLTFDFAAVGTVAIHGLTIIDVEASELPPLITYFDSTGAELATVALPATGDNGVAEVDLGNVTGVRKMLIRMRGSGALDELVLSRERPGDFAIVPDLFAVDLTPDGNTALLFDFFSIEGKLYSYDTQSGALAFETGVGIPTRAFPTGISATLRISAAYSDPNQAALWTRAGGWLDLGTVFPQGCVVDPVTNAQDRGSAFDVSADGGVAVGLVWDQCNARAFRWTEASGMVALQLLGSSFPGSSNPPSNRATKISDDGLVAGGFAQTAQVDRWPALWDASGNGFMLPAGVFPADAPGEVLSISADGTMVAGIWNLEGFYWTQASGVVPLGFLPGGLPGGLTFPNAIAAGGQLIFGKTVAGFFDPPTAFVWTAADGMRSLQEIALANGITIPAGLVLDNVMGASTDGTVVLGLATDAFFRTHTFVLKLPVSAYGL